MLRTASVKGDVSEPLLRFLRRTLDEPKLCYRTSPTIVAVGTEARIFRFGVRAGTGWAGSSLILRLTLDMDYPLDVDVEHAVQNVLAAQGFPAPEVYASSSDGDELCRPFVIMADADTGSKKDSARGSECPVDLHMKILAQLHALDGAPLRQAFAAHNVPREKRTGSVRYMQAEGIIERWRLDALRPLMAWVRSHRPANTGNSICHGDPHAGNLLMRGGKVAAMLDWPSARLGHPESDLGLLCGYRRCAELSPIPAAGADHDMLDAYRRNRACDELLVRYYEAEFLVSLMASVGDQQRRGLAGLCPPANPILDDPHTLSRLGHRLRQLVNPDVPIPKTLVA